MQNKDNSIDFGKIDLVNIVNQFSIFMYVNDLAYKQLPEELKHYTIEQHNEDVKKGIKPNYSPENTYYLDSVTLFKRIMKIFWGHSINFSIIDIGSQYGSFSMDLGAFIKRTGHNNSAYAFDCGMASNLCAENIKINMLDDVIQFEKKAISNQSSIQEVFFDIEHSEDNHIVKRPGINLSSYYVDGTSIDNYFKDHVENFIMKIDTQGAEPIVFDGMKTTLLKKPLILFEFTPWTFDLIQKNSIEFLKNIDKGYTFFEFQPNTNKIVELDRSHLDEFVKSVSESQAKWTDLLIIHQSSPIYDDLISEIKSSTNFKDTK